MLGWPATGGVSERGRFLASAAPPWSAVRGRLACIQRTPGWAEAPGDRCMQQVSAPVQRSAAGFVHHERWPACRHRWLTSHPGLQRISDKGSPAIVWYARCTGSAVGSGKAHLGLLLMATEGLVTQKACTTKQVETGSRLVWEKRPSMLLLMLIRKQAASPWADHFSAFPDPDNAPRCVSHID